MSSTLTLSGTLLATPVSKDTGESVIPVMLQEIMGLQKKYYTEVTLTNNSPQMLTLGNGITEANVMFVRASGGKVRLRLTSVDGLQQAIPVDPTFFLISKLSGITAIDVTRDVSVLVPVSLVIFFAQKI